MDDFASYKLPVSRRAARVRLSKAVRDECPKQSLVSEGYPTVDVEDGAPVASRKDTTEGLRLPDRLPFSKTDMLFVCFSIVTFFADIATDLKLAHSYYVHGDVLFFGLTLGFFVFSGVVSSAFSMYWYLHDYRAIKRSLAPDEVPSKTTWFVRGVCAVLLIAPVLRHLDVIRYGLKSRFGKRSPEERSKYFREMQYERVDGAMLRLFECFVEDAPQLVLQLYVVFSNGFPSATAQVTWTFVFQCASIVTSLVSLAWGLVAYHKALRYSRTDRRNLSHVGFAFQFLWRLFEVAPRVLAFAMFMLAHKYWLAVVVGCHWVAMSAWLLAMGSKFCPRLKLELLFVLVIAAIWVFCHFNIKDGTTRKRYVIYYAIVYTENVLMAILWYASVDGAPLRMQWHKDVVLPIIVGSFWIGILFMLIYYYFFHPNRPLPNCLPCSSYWLSCRDSPRDSRRASDRTDSKRGPPSVDMLDMPPIVLARLDSAQQQERDATMMAASHAAAAAEDDETDGADTSALLPPLLPPPLSQSRASLTVPAAQTHRLSSASPPPAAGFQPAPIAAYPAPAPNRHSSLVAARSPAAQPLTERSLPPLPAAFAQPSSEQQRQQPQDLGDSGYLKPLADSGYCRLLGDGGVAGTAEQLPLQHAAAAADNDDASVLLPPAYPAPLLPPPPPVALAAVAVANAVGAVEDAAHASGGDEDDVPVPLYHAPVLPGTAAADDLTDLPAYRAPTRPHSSALELDEALLQLRADGAAAMAARPLSALVDLRHRSERPPALIALPAAPRKVAVAGADEQPSTTAAAPLLPPASPPASATAPSACSPAPPALASGVSGSSPTAALIEAAAERGSQAAADDGSGGSGSAGDVTFHALPDLACGDVGMQFSTATAATPPRLPHGRADLPLQTPDLHRLGLATGGGCLSSAGAHDSGVLHTPDRVCAGVSDRMQQLMSDGMTPTADCMATYGFLTPETVQGHAQLDRLRGLPDGDLQLTPDRKLLAMGIGRLDIT